MTWLDRAIAWLSPGWAARRLQARAEAERSTRLGARAAATGSWRRWEEAPRSGDDYWLERRVHELRRDLEDEA